MRGNTTGTRNTAIGYQTLFSNTTGSFSVAIGLNTLFYNTTGSFINRSLAPLLGAVISHFEGAVTR